MGEQTNIEWADATWNPIVGCSVVSPGCTNCYAMRAAARLEYLLPLKRRGDAVLPNHYAALTRPSQGGPVWTGRVNRAPDDVFFAPLRWKRRRRIFVNSMGDLFHESVPDAWIDRVFAVMALAPKHTFQLLTKRSKRMREYLTTRDEFLPMVNIIDAARGIRPNDLYNMTDWPLSNVWLGVSAERQQEADERIPDLLATPAAVRFVSAEPLLGPIDFDAPLYRGEGGITMRGYLRNKAEPDDFHFHAAKLDWMIVGGESGPAARPMQRAWARSIRDQCASASVPFFFKQWGEWINADEWLAGLKRDGAVAISGIILIGDVPPLNFEDAARLARNAGFPFEHYSDGSTMLRVGKRRAGRVLDGVERQAFPAQPTCTHAV